MKTITKDFCYRGQHFTIVYDGKFYMTVNHNFIDENGCLTRELTFKELHPDKTVSGCIEYTKIDLDIDYYLSQGMSKAEAFSIVMNVPLEKAKVAFSE